MKIFHKCFFQVISSSDMYHGLLSLYIADAVITKAMSLSLHLPLQNVQELQFTSLLPQFPHLEDCSVSSSISSHFDTCFPFSECLSRF